MARGSILRLFRGPVAPGLCFAAASVRLFYSAQKGSFVENPGPSQLVVFIVAGFTLVLASAFSASIPFLHTSRHEERLLSEQNRNALSPRTIIVTLSALIVARLELLSRVTYDIACSRPGVQAFLPILLLTHEVFSNSKNIAKPDHKKDDDYDEMTATIWDDIWEWVYSIKDFKFTYILSVILVGCGSFTAAAPITRSTVFCSTVYDTAVGTFVSQYLGMSLDAIILLITWSLLCEAQSAAMRLKRLGTLFFCTAFLIRLSWLASLSYQSRGRSFEASLMELGLTRLQGLVTDGIVLALFLVYGTTLFMKDGPISPVIIATFFLGIFKAFTNIDDIETFHAVSKSAAISPLVLLCIGIALWVFSGASPAGHILVRGTLIIAAISVMVACTVAAIYKDRVVTSHPLHARIYTARTEQDRWLRYASFSQSLRVATSEYKARNYGRDPPENFDKWYEYAQARNSLIIDNFEQITRDLEPFWALSNDEISKGLKAVTLLPEVETITIKSGEVLTHSKHPVARDAVGMIEKFVQYLPDMEIPINLADQPRILAPYQQGSRKWGLTKAKLDRRNVNDGTLLAAPDRHEPTDHHDPSNPICLGTWRRMLAATCPSNTAIHNFNWNQRDLCRTCSEPHSSTQFFREVPSSLSLCHQPDILRQHSFLLSPPVLNPVPKLIPLFSRIKADAFSDILFPLRPFASHPGVVADNKPFLAKSDSLYWRGHLPNVSVSHDVWRAGHVQRMLHLIHNTTNSDHVILLVPAEDYQETKRLTYERVSALEASAALPFNVSHLVPNYTASVQPPPQAESLPPQLREPVRREFGGGLQYGTPFEARYQLLVDAAGSPQSPCPGTEPGALLAALRSYSLPFVATIFREWYSYRLFPWVHYVPLDLRWQGLHGTLAYFTGMTSDINKKTMLMGREMNIAGRVDDAFWIAEAGRKWVDRVVREDDAEVYAFRLLLEWGRLVGDRSKGFKVDGKDER